MQEEKVKVLLLDDNSLTLQSLSMALKMGGIENIAFTQPRSALEYFRREQQSVIMTDYRMPEMNGMEFIQQIREIKAATTCIMYTGYPEELDSRDEVLQNVKFFSKPLEIEQLINYINENLIKEAQDV